MGTEGTGEPHVVTLGDPGVLHQEVDAGTKSRTGELDLANVVLGDRQLRVHGAVGIGVLGTNHVSKGALVGNDPVGCRRQVLDHAVVVTQTGQEQFADDLDDRRAAQAGDVECCGLLGEFGLVAPYVGTDHLEAGLVRVVVDPDALDRSGGRAHARRDLRALERRAGRRGCGVGALGRAEHDLGVGADIDHQLWFDGGVCAFVECGRRSVGADMAGDARADMAAGVGQAEIKISGSHVDRFADGERERCGAQRRRVDAQ